MSILASCATPSPPAVAVDLPAVPLAQACDPRVSAELDGPPDVPAGASIVQPVTPEERRATQLHLTWVAALLDYAGVLFERAAVAKVACEDGRAG